VPTTDVYIAARAGAAPAPLQIVDTLREHPPATAVSCTDLVLVRHASRSWLLWIARHRDAFARISLLMDDDMPQALAAAELPLGYAWRTARRHRNAARLLAGTCDELWLSTPELLSRYAGPRTLLCEPLFMPAPEGLASPARQEPVYFYHGTRAHLDEIRWLVPVVSRVQERSRSAVFEVFGDALVQRFFRGIPRVRVRPWLSWQDYLAYCCGHRFRVGLAPCLDTPFNRARAPVKYFDITRLGAAGVYADLAPYSGMVKHGETGLLCAQRPDDWAESILDLLDGAERASAMASAARRDCLEQRMRVNWPTPGCGV